MSPGKSQQMSEEYLDTKLLNPSGHMDVGKVFAHQSRVSSDPHIKPLPRISWKCNALFYVPAKNDKRRVCMRNKTKMLLRQELKLLKTFYFGAEGY
jgi:hypothetical protein